MDYTNRLLATEVSDSSNGQYQLLKCVKERKLGGEWTPHGPRQHLC